jgi:hypothetical protein
VLNRRHAHTGYAETSAGKIMRIAGIQARSSLAQQLQSKETRKRMDSNLIE